MYCLRHKPFSYTLSISLVIWKSIDSNYLILKKRNISITDVFVLRWRDAALCSFCHSLRPVSGVPGNFFPVGGSSKNSVEDRGQRERRSEGGSPLVRGSTQFANEWTPYVVTDLFSTDLGIWPSFWISGGGGGWTPNPTSVRHCMAPTGVWTHNPNQSTSLSGDTISFSMTTSLFEVCLYHRPSTWRVNTIFTRYSTPSLLFPQITRQLIRSLTIKSQLHSLITPLTAKETAKYNDTTRTEA
jgi:hypothetical protein